ncbi:hypothetical protein [Streptomyces sp. SID5606]|uniref:hypothetical protein n=1 Tax=Streptomyces sp. SID5606 TaxID=2690305 RepID=UPI00136F70F3|nr:hypothetical protein [Streptomyces sp. SID5606]MZD58831.1 hypothetical protein [Streptomyces sp. SID5606]
MKRPANPVVLVIDDEPEVQQGFTAVMGMEGLKVVVRRPHEVTVSDLKEAHVIAIDYVFEWATLPHPQELSYWPADGLALAGVVSRHLTRLRTRASVVLRTGAVSELAGDLPRQVRVPLLAAQSGLDWILEKGTTDNAENIRELADASAALEPFFRSEGSLTWNEGCDWLRLPASDWQEAALAEIQVCRPPEHVVASYTSGSAWLRWFTQRILPFPAFLVSDLRAATLLHVSLAQFRAITQSKGTELSRRLQGCAYNGHLAGLVEPRWWRAGLEHLVDELLIEADPSLPVPDALASRYAALHGGPVQVLPYERPVVTIDADYKEDGVAEFEECVRLAPDAWPVFADEPYALREDAVDLPELGAMVSRGDRGRVNSVGM